METKNFLGLEGLNHFWEKAKIWIINEITTKIAGIVLSSVPTGTILPGMWKSAPKGFLLCNGATYPTSQYPKLASVLGATGSTFKVPNLVGRFLEGANSDVGTYKDAGLPNITGSIGVTIGSDDMASGAFYNNGTAGISKTHGASIYDEYYTSTKVFNASRSSNIYGKSSTVQPASFKVNYIIKY